MGSSKRIRDVIEPFQVWLGDRATTVDVDWVAMLLDLKEGHLESGDPCTWRTGDIDRLLLSVVPRKVIDDDPSDGSTAEAFTAYLEFLHETARFGVGSAPYPGLVRELVAALEEYPDALADSSRWGVGKSIMGAASAAGIDPNGPDGVEAMMEFFNALPDEERDRILADAVDGDAPFDVFDEDDELDELDVLNAEVLNAITGVAEELPLVRLASESELVADAGQAAAIANLRAFVETIRPECELPALDSLPPADSRMWSMALESGLLSVRGDRVEPAPGGAELDRLSDAELLELWENVADAVLGWWVLEDQPRGVGIALHWILARAYAARAAVGFDEGIGQIQEPDRPFTDAERTSYLDALREAAGCLTGVGYVVLEADAVRLTRLGDYAMSGRLEMAGMEPLTLGPTEELDAIDLVDVWPVLCEDDAGRLLDEWVAIRGAEPAVSVLLEEAGSTDAPALRALALVIAEKIDAPEVVDVYRRAVDVPALRPYAHNWLFRHGYVQAPYAEPEDRAYMVVDGLAGLMGLVGPDEAAEELDRMIEPAEQLAFLSAVWRCDHPELLSVLTVVGDKHPDAAIRKAARKSLFKARTRSVVR